MGKLKPKVNIDKITTLEMEIALMELFKFRQNIIIPNVSWGLGIHECDLFIVRRSMYAIEVEIKISKSDLLKDFEKVHGHIDTKNRIREFHYAMPIKLYEQCKDFLPKDCGIIVCEKKINYKKKEIVKARVIRKSKINSTARKLTEIEYLKLLRLGCLRIYSMKKTLHKLK